MDILQKKNFDLFKCANHIRRIGSVIAGDCSKADATIKDIFKDAGAIDKEIELKSFWNCQE